MSINCRTWWSEYLGSYFPKWCISSLKMDIISNTSFLPIIILCVSCSFIQQIFIDHLLGKIPWRREWLTHSSILAWRIPWAEEPGRLQFMGLQRVGHDWAISTHLLGANASLVSEYTNEWELPYLQGSRGNNHHTVQGGSSVTEENIDYSGNMVKSHSTGHWEMALQFPVFLLFFFFFPQKHIVLVCVLSHFSCVWLFAALWTAVPQALLSLGFSRQEYWSRLPCSRGSSRLRDQTCVSYVSCIGRWVLYHLCHLVSPKLKISIPKFILVKS